jgi:hypothetical protein
LAVKENNMIRTGKKLKSLPKMPDIVYPSFYISDLKKNEMKSIPDEGSMVIKHRVISRSVNPDNKSHSMEVQVRGVHVVPQEKGKARGYSDRAAMELLMEGTNKPGDIKLWAH